MSDTGMKTIIKDEKAELTRLREQLVDDIGSAWAGLQASLEQVRRRWYHKLGELFIQLRMTFPKGHEADIQFAAFCKKHWPKIGQPQRSEYIAYRKKLGPVTSISAEIDLPPLRRITEPYHARKHVSIERDKSDFKRIVDDVEIDQFDVPRSKSEVENELVVELAGKIINAGFRVLAVKMHPDKDGGSNEAQRRLNAAKKLLESALLRESLRR
jgi:hypothetical protein